MSKGAGGRGVSTPRSAGIPIQSSDPSSAFRSDFCKDFYNGPDEFGDTAPGTSDPDRYYTGLHAHSDILMSKASNQKTKSGKKALNPKKSSTVSSKGIQKAVVIANNRTEKQSRHIPREHEMAAFSPGKSMEESVLLGIPISEKHLSVEAKKIEQQIAGKDIIDLIDLTRLGLTMITYLLSHLSKKKTILTVDLSHNSIKQIPDCFQLDIIQRFHARYNAIRSVCIKGSMNALLELDLNSNEITEFPSVDALEKMPSLKTLILYGNKIKTLPEDSIMYLAEIGLKDLNLSFNELSELPVQICEMTSLRVLRLSNNYIKRLPRDIVQLQLIGPNAFDITGNQLVYPPQDVAKLGMNNIRSYFSLENESSIRFNQFKLIVVGHESAGKTSIITYLMTYNVNTEALPSPVGSRGDASFPPPWNRAHSDENIMGGIPLAGPSLRSVGRTRSGMSSISDASSTKPAGRTVGLEISTLHLSIPNQQISGTPRVAQGSRIDAEVVDDDIVYLSIWDFAGQEVYHSAHEVFFSAQALYLIVWNMTENSHAFIETKVQFWIDLVQVRAPGSKVIIVATHADECGEEKEYILRILQEQLTENESLRLHDIKAELQQLQGQLETTIYGTSAYKQLKLKMALLKKSLNMRPQIVSFAPVIAETEIDGSIKNDYNIESLVAAIRHVSTATADEQNPFQLVNVFHPRFYGYVKQAAEVLRRSRTIITMEALHEASLIEARVSSSAPTIKETESAVAFLSCIGEVVWFRDRSMCSYDDDDYSDGESEGAPFYDEDSSYPGNSNDRDDSATWAWVESLDIGSYVVLNPHWLLNAVKGVLTHELSTDVHFLRQSMGSVEIDRRFGQSNDERNGIVRWPLIEALLSRNSEIASEPNERHNTLQVLRLLLEHFNIIVPIKLDISNPETASTLPSNGNRSQDIQESPLTSSTIGIASILTVSGCTAHDVLRSTSTSDLLSPTYSSPLCPRANSGGYLNALNSSGGERSRIPASPLTSAASTSELQTLHLRGVSDPTGSKASSGFMSCKRNRSVGDILSEASRTPVLDVPDEYFLVPALLNDINRPKVPKFARPGQIRMERRFRLQRFLPPGLIPRIIACSYQYTKERPTASRYAGALNQCWKSAFSQRHGAVLIWLWLEDNTALHEDFEKVDRASIRVVGFGNYFGAKVIVEWLEKYCTAVTHVLKEFPGLCHLSQTIVCPTCLMSQFEEDECGEFSYTDLHCQLDENHGDQCPVPNSSSAIGTEMDEIRFEHKQAMCDKRQCMIPFELLVTKPHNAIVAPVSENTMQRQMERRIEYLTNEIIRLSSVPSSSCEKAVASVAVAYIPTIEMAYIKTWVASGKENSSDISMCSTPVATAYLKTLATGAFTRIPCCGGKTTATVVLSCAHFCINDTTKLFPIADLPGYDTIFLIGDTDNWLYLGELITLGTAFVDRNATDLLSSSQLNSKPTVYNCQRCLVENHVDNRQCSHCEQRRLGEGFWDVSALSATYKISPTPRLNRENTITIEPLGFADLNGQHAYEVCPEMPTREQSLRLLGLSGLSSLSSDFGRVIQIMNGLLLVNVYNDNGASGGPVLDRLGRLAGVMSCVNPDETGKAYIEPIGNFTSLLQSHYFFNNRHDPLTCSFCVEQPLVRDKFCWRG